MHSPAFEHITCSFRPPSVGDRGMFAHAGPTGHSRSEQSTDPICRMLSEDP